MSIGSNFLTRRTTAGYNPGSYIYAPEVYETQEVPNPVIDYSAFLTTQTLADGTGFRPTTAEAQVTIKGQLELASFSRLDLEANQVLDTTHTHRNERTFTLGCAAYLLVKVDQAYLAPMNTARESFMREVRVKAEERKVEFVMRYIAELFRMGVDKAHMGNAAGGKQSYKLGTIGKPFRWNSDLFPMMFSRAKAILSEANMWDPNNAFAFMPVQAEFAIDTARHKFPIQDGYRSETFGISLPDRLYGFFLVKENTDMLYVGRTSSAERFPIYNIYFGVRHATVFYATDLNVAESNVQDVRELHDFIRFMVAFFGIVTQPKGLVRAVVALDTSVAANELIE